MPSFDFSNSTGRWMPKAGEFAQLLNAHSVTIPHLERFLNRVMARARTEIRGDDPASQQLRADISTFIKQESCHYTIHGAFNAMLLRNGYHHLPVIEQKIAAHYDKLLATKSLPFLLAYCEGFESLTPPTAAGWFDGSMDPMMKDADPNPAMMWRWHIMEEFEHRTVCYDAFKKVHGGHLLRAYGFFYQMISLGRMVGWVFSHLMEVDRMTPEQAVRSKQNARRSVMGFFKPIMQAIPRILAPGYSPRQIPEPTGWSRARTEIETNWMKPGTPSPSPA
jgi:predicted metal-dependent hydrolase